MSIDHLVNMHGMMVNGVFKDGQVNAVRAYAGKTQRIIYSDGKPCKCMVSISQNIGF